ncbi:MAG: response regulator [Rhodospirillales bacterium]|nr:response regulator [Rhodospirillales bacterium]MCW8951725.1 response regulator [Rhodospirillales bacterium]
MKAYHYDAPQILISEPSAKLRGEIEAALRSVGFSNITATGNLQDVMNALEDGYVDLMICDTKLPEGNLNEVVRDLRHGEIGPTPFVVTITMISNPNDALFKEVINSGTDTAILKPFDVTKLVERVVALGATRKPFVVTTDYIGPDRRGKPRPGTQEIPRFKVPNPFGAKLTGIVDDWRLNRDTDRLGRILNEQKIQRHGYQIAWLTERLEPILMGESSAENREVFLNRLSDVSRDLIKRVEGTPYKQAQGLCSTMIELAGQLLRESPPHKENDDETPGLHVPDTVSLLVKLTAAMKRNLMTDDERRNEYEKYLVDSENNQNAG